MGTVYRCHDQQLDRSVAVKRMHADTANSAMGRTRFAREAKAISDLAHPNIVTLLDSGEDEHGPYLVMELLAGCDLARWVADHGVMAPPDVVDIARQACLGLRFAHQRKLIHRDIKPSNLQRLPDGTIKLLDFGIARGEASLGTNTQTQAQGLGTHEFAAPEQRADSKQASARSDLYSLGATLYWLLHSHTSFHEGYAPSVPAPLRELITALLKRDPKERPTSAEDVQQRLARISTTAVASPSPSLPSSGASVTCAHCGAENLAISRYCVDCSEEVHVRCYQCNEPDLQRRRYCAHCRADLHARRHYLGHVKRATAAADSRSWSESVRAWEAALLACPGDSEAGKELERVRGIQQSLDQAWASIRKAAQQLDVSGMRRAGEVLRANLPADDAQLLEFEASTLPQVIKEAGQRQDALATHRRRATEAVAARRWPEAIEAWQAAAQVQSSPEAEQGIAHANKVLKEIPIQWARCERAAQAHDLAAMESALKELERMVPQNDERWLEWSTSLAPNVRSKCAAREARIRDLKARAEQAEAAKDFGAAVPLWRDLCELEPSQWTWQTRATGAQRRVESLAAGLALADKAMESRSLKQLEVALEATKEHAPVSVFKPLQAILDEWKVRAREHTALVARCKTAINEGRYLTAADNLAVLESGLQLDSFGGLNAALRRQLDEAKSVWSEHAKKFSQAIRIEGMQAALRAMKAHAPLHPDLIDAGPRMGAALARRSRQRLLYSAIAVACACAALGVWYRWGVILPRQAIAVLEGQMQVDLAKAKSELNASKLTSAQNALKVIQDGLNQHKPQEAARAAIPNWLPFSGLAASYAAKASKLPERLTECNALLAEVQERRHPVSVQVEQARKALSVFDFNRTETTLKAIQLLDQEADQVAFLRSALNRLRPLKDRLVSEGDRIVRQLANAELFHAEISLNGYKNLAHPWQEACSEFKIHDSLTEGLVAKVQERRREFETAMNSALNAASQGDRNALELARLQAARIQAENPFSDEFNEELNSRLEGVDAARLALDAMANADLETAERVLKPHKTKRSSIPKLEAAIQATESARSDLNAALSRLESAAQTQDTKQVRADVALVKQIQQLGPDADSADKALNRHQEARIAKIKQLQAEFTNEDKADHAAKILNQLSGHEAEFYLTDDWLDKAKQRVMELRVINWATVEKAYPDPTVIGDSSILKAIEATGLPWCVEENKTGIRMVLIPRGSYTRGASPGDKEAYNDEFPSHDVVITEAFYIGVYEVSQREWQRLMVRNPSRFTGDLLPVENVSWDDIQAFCRRSNGLQIPTEGEWEYACRGGNDGVRYGELRQVAWYTGNSLNATRPVGGLLPNRYGVYDMLGNVWEWCSDWYADYASIKQVDPSGPSSGDKRVGRGGSWGSSDKSCRASTRLLCAPSLRDSGIGFRVVKKP
jgi:formylglycine-generating enzyme required for sulfatase activity/tRNA A-37 threonylcarbamoyl transferase component Bud32